MSKEPSLQLMKQARIKIQLAPILLDQMLTDKPGHEALLMLVAEVAPVTVFIISDLKPE